LLDRIECPACHKVLRHEPDNVGTVVLCPFCEQAFVVCDSDLAFKPGLVREREGSYARQNRASGLRPSGITAISVIGICSCGVIFAAAALLALSCMNSVVAPVTESVREVTEGVREAVPVVPTPTTRAQKIMSAFVMVAFTLIFLLVCIGLLRRREWARRVFTIFSWMAFAVFAGAVIGIFIMPGNPIKAWTLFVFLPAVVYFGLAFLYLRRKDIKAWFLQAKAVSRN